MSKLGPLDPRKGLSFIKNIGRKKIPKKRKSEVDKTNKVARGITQNNEGQKSEMTSVRRRNIPSVSENRRSSFTEKLINEIKSGLSRSVVKNKLEVLNVNEKQAEELLKDKLGYLFRPADDENHIFLSMNPMDGDPIEHTLYKKTVDDDGNPCLIKCRGPDEEGKSYSESQPIKEEDLVSLIEELIKGLEDYGILEPESEYETEDYAEEPEEDVDSILTASSEDETESFVRGLKHVEGKKIQSVLNVDKVKAEQLLEDKKGYLFRPSDDEDHIILSMNPMDGDPIEHTLYKKTVDDDDNPCLIKCKEPDEEGKIYPESQPIKEEDLVSLIEENGLKYVEDR